MLLKHSASYILARGVPGLIAFAALVAYTRLLSPESFGRYALVVAGIMMVDVALFQWLRLVVFRFYPGNKLNPGPFLSSLVTVFLALALVISTLGLLLALCWPDPVWRKILVFSVPLLILHAAYEGCLSVASSQLAPGFYGRLRLTDASASLFIGALFAWFGVGAIAPISGLLVGHLFMVFLFLRAIPFKLYLRWPEAPYFRQYLRYGLPLALTFALGWVITSSDRLLIGWIMDESAVGLYAVGYDLAQHSLGLILMTINTAAFPLAMHKHQDDGSFAASAQLKENGLLIVTLALGGAAGLVLLAPPIVDVLVGREFRQGALTVLPWVAVVAALNGIKSYHFDVAFHLSEKSRVLVYIALISALTNIALNLILIPAYGVLGAAWASVVSVMVATISSAWYGKKVYPMPSFGPIASQAMSSTGIILFFAWIAIVPVSGAWSLLSGVAGGLAGGIIAACFFNIGGARGVLKSYFSS